MTKELISATDARKTLMESARHSKTYQLFLDALDLAIKDGRTQFTVYRAENDDLMDWELAEIRSKGYNVSWGRALTWYTVYF